MFDVITIANKGEMEHNHFFQRVIIRTGAKSQANANCLNGKPTKVETTSRKTRLANKVNLLKDFKVI